MVSSINTIGPAELAIKQRNLKNTLAGQIAGVIAIQRSGEPGNDASAFFIRGQSSYAGGVNPLVLVDGIPRSMDDIDVDEIESFTVLKDAAATAVYGAEGANGVVLITSKRGKVQKTQVNFSAQYSIVTPTRMPETLNSYDYMSMYNEAVWNTKGNPDLENYIPHYSTELLEKYRNGEDPDLYPSVDWFDLLKKHTQSQRYTINFRGGSDKVRYFASGSYYKEDGIFESNSTEKYNANIGLQRFNLRSNIDMDLSKSTLLSIDMSGQYTMKNQPGFSSDDIFAKIAGLPVHVIHRREPDFVPGLADSGPQGLYLPVATRPEADEAAFGNIKSKLPDTPDKDSGVLQFHCIGKCPDQDGEPDLLHLRDQHGRKKLTAEIQINHCRLNCFSERSRFLEPPFRFSKITPRTEISAHSAGNFQSARRSVRARFWPL